MKTRSFTIFLCLTFVLTFPALAKLTDKEKSVVNAVDVASSTTNKKIVKPNDKIISDPSKKPVSKPDKISIKVEERLAKIEVSGVDSELKKNIELHMPVTIPSCTADRGEVRLFFTNVKKNLRKASRALGYYDAEFRSGGKIVKNCWNLSLIITPGNPTKIVSQTIKVIGEGSKEELFQTILKEKPYQKGDTLNHDKYATYKTKLAETAQGLGYFDAEFEQHSIRVDPIAYKASITLILNTHKRYQYGEITISQDILSDEVLKEYLTLKTGQPYEAEALIKQQQFLQSSGYYQLIKIEVLYDQAKDFRIPIKISLTSKKRNNYKFKVGYGTDTGARVSAEMKRRWTGKSGRQLNAKVQLAQKLSSLSLELTDPQKNPDDKIVTYHIDYTQDKQGENNVNSNSIDIGVKYTRKDSKDWIRTASTDLLLDETETNNTVYLLFAVGLEKTKADDLLYPEKGWRVRYNLQGASKALGSTQDIVQFEALFKHVNKIGKGHVVNRLHLGTTLAKELIDLPKRLRFFAGGANSVRGYAFDSLGDFDEGDDKVIGGKQLLNLSLEYQHPISEQWGVAVFADAGNAFDDWSDPKLKAGVGFGARWRSPIGPVRIDIGFPLDDVNGERGNPQLHLSVGSEL